MDTTTDLTAVAEDRDPRLALDWAEVVNICDLLERAAALLTLEDGCCHQIHGTGRWRDSRLIGGWLADLATNLNQRSNAALHNAQYEDRCRRTP
jgi:hypothetical protein